MSGTGSTALLEDVLAADGQHTISIREGIDKNEQIDALSEQLEALRREPVVADQTITNEGEIS
ncbi:hypothetical protein [Arthrobacter bambusae]|uniref:Uncharacterized protein n=1 Tax=Arthrobacter bambusae TaxID=1338426 RepID=A0AAW8DA82_9MICC|nr:hypothetical protein [Arthrobacter bambusae]MDP9904718.1 hypothetical protein [Arthrobacter bambusae]MDQ0129534.1 hypothetical protein [Arthrobacter bambusae]MDQ0180853.1 hypothetical protein [Arthrobacter bambusae]